MIRKILMDYSWGNLYLFLMCSEFVSHFHSLILLLVHLKQRASESPSKQVKVGKKENIREKNLSYVYISSVESGYFYCKLLPLSVW